MLGFLMGTLGKIWPSTWVLGIILALSFALPLPQNGKILGVPSICAFQNFFGLPCPGCGLTRAFVAMAHGQFSDSLRWHPLGPALFLAFAAYFLISLFCALKKSPLQTKFRLQLYSLSALGAVLLVFWVLRLSGTFPFPSQ